MLDVMNRAVQLRMRHAESDPNIITSMRSARGEILYVRFADGEEAGKIMHAEAALEFVLRSAQQGWKPDFV